MATVPQMEGLVCFGEISLAKGAFNEFPSAVLIVLDRHLFRACSCGSGQLGIPISIGRASPRQNFLH